MSGPPIRRSRVHKLATGEAIPERPGDPRGAAVKSGWDESYASVLAMAKARSVEDVDRLQISFRMAFARFKGYASLLKCHPMSHGGQVKGALFVWSRDPELQQAVIRLQGTVRGNPLFHDPERFPGPHAIGAKILKMCRWLLSYRMPR